MANNASLIERLRAYPSSAATGGKDPLVVGNICALLEEAATALSAPESMREAAELADALEEWGEQEGVMPAGANILQRAAAFFRALPVPAQAGEGWNRDMEAAPKDGTEILLYGFGRHRNSPHYRYGNGHHVGWWSDGAWMTRDPDTDCEPHAWQPLPAAPVSPKGE